MTATEPTAEAVLMLPTAAKRKLLNALLGDVGVHGVVYLELPDGPLRMYLPPPNARELAEESLRNATPEELAESLRRASDPDSEFMSIEEVKMIGRQAPPPASQVPSAPAVGATAGGIPPHPTSPAGAEGVR